MSGIRKIFNDFLGDNSLINQRDYPSRPFWVHALTGDPDVIRDDIINRVRAFRAANSERFLLMRFNLAIYAGLEYFPEDVKQIATIGLQPQLIGGKARVTSNHVQRLVDTQVTDVLSSSQDISVLPTGDRFEDGVLAEMIQELLDSLEYEHQKGQIVEMLNRRARLCGEAYRWITWNPDKGDEHPSSKKLREKGETLTLELPDGTSKRIDVPIMQGDVCEEYPLPWDIGLEPAAHPWQCNWCFKVDARPVDELRVDYPDMAKEIIPNDNTYEWSDELMQPTPLKDHAMVITFYQRSNKYMPQGYKVVCTPSVTLEHGHSDMPLKIASMWGNLPVERLTDADIDGVLHGWSRLRNITQLQNQYDNSTTQIGQNIFISARPKWLFPAGSVQINRLANKETLVPYKGPVAPALATFPSVPNEVFIYRDAMLRDMEKNYKVHPMASGDIPKGITATSALQFLSTEQEKAMTMQRKKNEEFIISTHHKRFSICKDNYDTSDKRFISVMKGSSWKVKYFDVNALQIDCEIKMSIGSDLPQRKDALMQTVFQMSQIWPTLFPDEAIADMFKIGHAKKFLNEARAAWQAAEDENYRASKGEKLENPEEWENMLVHWRAHAKQFQLPEFKRWPKKRQEELLNHQRTTEFLMLIKLKQNPVFAAQIQQLPSWPMTLALPPDFGAPQQSLESGIISLGAQLQDPNQVPQEQVEPQEAQAASNAGVNQIRFPNGQFGPAAEQVR
jgi:hypothetical protein